MKLKLRSLPAASFIACSALLVSTAHAQAMTEGAERALASRVSGPLHILSKDADLSKITERVRIPPEYAEVRSGDEILPRDSAPEWAVHLVGSLVCGGTLIGERTVVVPAHCARAAGASRWTHSVRFHQDRDDDGRESAARPVVVEGDGGQRLGVMLLERASQRTTAIVPSYWREAQLLKTPRAPMSLFGWHGAHPEGILKRGIGKEIPSVSAIRVDFTMRGGAGDVDGAGVMAHTDDRSWWFMGMVSRRTDSKQNHGIALRQMDRSLYRALLGMGPQGRREALIFATKRLNPFERAAQQWGTEEQRRQAAIAPQSFDLNSFGRRGVVGSIYPYDNPHTNQIEFFQLVAVDEQGAYEEIPSNATNSRHWAYLGTDLPAPEIQ